VSTAAEGTLTEEQRTWLSLSLVPGVGSTLFIRLLARFGTPATVLSASEAALREVVGPKVAQRIRQYREVVDIHAQERALEAYGARLLTMDDPAYPEHLAEIYDPPLALFCRGQFDWTAAPPALAIVGTRRPTSYGHRMAGQLAEQLAARGLTVVSGMATGIDAAAHEGALKAGGQTLAVLGCGVDVVYPAENAELMHRIMQQGAVVSSFPMGIKPSRGHFPYRNRIISGLCLGVIVVEAPPGSGSLITARNAAEQGREVFAVPGHAGERNALGPHSLIREGAKLVESVDDIVAELDLPAHVRQSSRPSEEPAAVPQAAAAPAATPSKPTAPTPNLQPHEADVLSVLSPDGSFVDEVALACRMPVSQALSTLTLLELKGLARQFSGKRFAPR